MDYDINWSEYSTHGSLQRGKRTTFNENHYTNGKLIYQLTTQKTPPKTSITQRLRTDLGRSVTTAITLVWLKRLTGAQPSHKPQKSRVIKMTHLEICK